MKYEKKHRDKGDGRYHRDWCEGIPSMIDLAYKLIDLMEIDIKIQKTSNLEGSVSRRCPDTSKLTKLTKFEPKIDLNEGLLKTIKWYSS